MDLKRINVATRIAIACFLCVACAQGPSRKASAKPLDNQGASSGVDSGSCEEVVLAAVDGGPAVPEFLADETTICWNETPARRE